MSNTEEDQQEPDLLDQLPKLTLDLSQFGTAAVGERITAAEAEAILNQRGHDELSINGNLTDLTPLMGRYIIATIGEEHLTAGVVSTIDFRPFIAAMQTKTKELDPTWDGVSIINFKDDSTPDEDRATYLAMELEFLAGRVTKAEAKAAEEGMSASGVAPTYALGSTVGLSPFALNGQYAQQVASGEVDPTAPTADGEFVLGSDGEPTTTIPVDDLRLLLATDQITLEQLVSEESAYGQPFPVAMTDPTGPGMRPHARPAPARPSETTSILSALGYLTTLSKSEVTTMQHRLADAGYYDRLGAGTMIEWGDPLDPATKQAWSMMIKDSVARNQPVPKIMADAGRQYRTTVRESRLAALDPLNQGTIALTANDLAQATIGRNLTGAEATELVTFLEQLRSDRAGWVEGMTTNPATGRLPTNGLGVTGDDIATYVADEFDNEAASTSWGEFLYKTERMFS